MRYSVLVFAILFLCTSPASATVETEKNTIEEYTQKLLLSRDKVLAKKYFSAARMLTSLTRSAPEPVRQQAMELLGVTYERSGRISQAVSVYKQYIREYKKGSDVERIQQRLNHMLESELVARAPIESTSRQRTIKRPFTTTITQYYYNSRSLFENEPSASTDQSSLASNLSTRWRQRNRNADMRARLQANYLNDFTESENRPLDISKAYFSYKNRKTGLQGKLGRQSGSNMGLLGKFDGAVAGMRLPSRARIDIYSGYPVRFNTKSTVNTEEHFYGAGLTLSPRLKLHPALAGQYEFKPYYIEHTTHELTARRAIGSSVQYFSKDLNLRMSVDYDVMYAKTNLFSFSIEQNAGKNLWMLQYDTRRNPLLDAHTALLATTQAQDIEELRLLMTDEEIQKLAEQLTGKASTVTLGLQRIFNQHIDAYTDITRTIYEYRQADENENIVSFSDGSISVSSRMIAKHFTPRQEVTISGLTLTFGDAYQNRLLYLNSRWPIKRNWRITGKLRQYKRENDSGLVQNRFYPGVEVSVKPSRDYDLRLELAREWFSYEGNTQNSDYTRTNLSLGYSYFF